jgi:hypothetical protein
VSSVKIRKTFEAPLGFGDGFGEGPCTSATTLANGKTLSRPSRLQNRSFAIGENRPVESLSEQEQHILMLFAKPKKSGQVAKEQGPPRWGGCITQKLWVRQRSFWRAWKLHYQTREIVSTQLNQKLRTHNRLDRVSSRYEAGLI